MNWLPQREWKADASSVSPSSERLDFQFFSLNFYFSREIGLFPRKLFTQLSLNFWTNYTSAVFNWVLSLTKNRRVLCIITFLIYLIPHKNTDGYRWRGHSIELLKKFSNEHFTKPKELTI